jgi:hypothetical protein
VESSTPGEIGTFRWRAWRSRCLIRVDRSLNQFARPIVIVHSDRDRQPVRSACTERDSFIDRALGAKVSYERLRETNIEDAFSIEVCNFSPSNTRESVCSRPSAGSTSTSLRRIVAETTRWNG